MYFIFVLYYGNIAAARISVVAMTNAMPRARTFGFVRKLTIDRGILYNNSAGTAFPPGSGLERERHMEESRRQRKALRKNKSLRATGIVIAIIVGLLLIAYFRITASIRERSLGRMEEGVNTVIEEVTSKLMRDSRLLNAMADTISRADNFDREATLSVMMANEPLLETMKVRVLLADDQVLLPDGSVIDAASENLSFAEEAALGEHISDRVSTVDGRDILRHFVPIMQDGRTAAVLYGVTDLDSLPDSLNIDNIYNASASVYVIDTRSGQFIMDTWHDHLGNIKDYSAAVSPRKTKGDQTWDAYTADMMNQGTGYVVFRTPNTDGWEYMYYAPAGINAWEIAVSVPEREAFASVFAVQRICLVLGILLAVVIVLYYGTVSRSAKETMRQAVDQAVLTEKLQKAEAADRAKSAFLSNMSHDIRTPMNAIIGFTTLAQTNLDNREKVQEYLKKILASSNHMLSLINDILDMSRIESGKLNIEEKECSLSDIFRDMRDIIQTQMHAKQLDFYMDAVDVIDEDIYCDKLHVNQVLLNLLSNAIKFTPPGGTVALTIRQKSRAPKGYGSYEIRVKDTGIGMSEEFTRHIFEPFERERNTTASGIQGTGLGMAIAKNIIDAMGGTIELHSEPGKGTEFIINLDFRLQTEPKKEGSVAALQGMRALVVDDSYTTCDSITKMLMQIGMRPEWVLHGKEAVLHARQAYELGDEYYAYIVDWFLPDLNGLEVVRQIRGIVGDSTPIIVVTAYDWSPFEEEARAAGVTAFCNKPIFLSDLRDVLIAAGNDSLRAQEMTDRAQEKHDLAQRLKGTRLLLTEDNELNREIAVELLTEKGFVVDTAEDGTVAVEKVKNAEPGYYALVLMDIQMPKMNGYDATRAIRALEDPARAGIPIVAMTANAFDEDRKKALESGMNAHVAKPIDVDQLMTVLEEILEIG